MNAVENRIRMFAVSIVSANTYNDIVEVMHSIAYYIGDYSDEMNAYFTGLYDYIDKRDIAFKPLTVNQKYSVQNLGASLLLKREDIITALVRLHHLLGWIDGEKSIITLVDALDSVADERGIPSVKWDD